MSATAFAMAALAGLLSQAPQSAVFWATSPVMPGEAAMLCGSFSSPDGLVVSVEREPDNGREAAPVPPRSLPTPQGPAHEATILQASETAVIFELPDLGGPGVYRVTLFRRAGQAHQALATAWLNAPEVWWLLGDAGRDLEAQDAVAPDATVYGTPGGWIRVNGRCLTLAEAAPRVFLRLEDRGREAGTVELAVETVPPRASLAPAGGVRWQSWLPRPETMPPGPAPTAAGGQGTAPAAQGRSAWSLRALVPDTIPVGAEGRLLVYNGHGSAACWADGGGYRVRIVPKTDLPSQLYQLAPAKPPAEGERLPFPETEVTHLSVADFGASGDDSTDDTAAIQAALDAAGKARGVAVVHLPRGRFFLSAGLVVPPYTMLAGEGMHLTALAVPDTDEPPDAWVQGAHHFALQDLTLYCSNHRHIIGGDMTGDPTTSGHVCLRRVRVRGDAYRGHLKPEEVDERFRASLKLSTGGGDTVRFSGPDIVVADCDLYGSGRSLYCFAASGALLARNRLHNGRWGWYNLNVCRDVVFEDNDLIGGDLMSTGGGYACYGPWTRSENIHTRHNTYSLMHGWDREAFTSDAGGGAYFGGFSPVERGEGADLVVELSDDPQWGDRPWQGALFAVIAGHGRGFLARVVTHDARRVTVRPLVSPGLVNHALGATPDWAPLFDDTSRATVTQMHRRYVFEGCDFSDAGIGIQYYGTAIENVATANTTTRSGGFHGLGITYHGVQPDLFCQWLGNEILEGNSYRFGANNAQAAGPSHLGITGRSPSAQIGAVVRGNHLHNNASIEVSSENGTDAVENVIVEANTVEHSDVGLRVRDGLGVLYRNNRFTDCAREVRDAVAEVKRWREAVAALGEGSEPLAWWSFDETAAPATGAKLLKGRSPLDLDLTTTLHGSPTLAPGVHGQALKLDGKSYAEAASDGVCFSLNLSSFTVALWVNPDFVNGRWGFVSKRTGHSQSPFVLGMRNGEIVYEATDQEGKWTSYNFSSPPVLVAGEWQHVAAVVEEGKRVVLYHNGRPVATRDLAGQKLATNEQALRIGWEAWGGDPPKADVPGYLTGLIDEVKIWPRCLSPEEVAAEARRP